MTKQFENVSSKYGAPMGRVSAPDLDTSPHSVRLFAVRLDSGGYDDGGAYWGYGGAGGLYCARDKDGSEQFTRAPSRESAALLLNIPAPALRVPFNWREYCRRWREAGYFSGLTVTAYAEACEVVEKEAEPTRVVFRVWNHKPDRGHNGQVIALFPDDRHADKCGAYEHVGQHGDASYPGVIESTRPATAEESAPLRRELESAPYHYNLREVKRR